MIARISSWLLAALLAVSSFAVELPRNLDDDFISENKATTLHGKSAPKQPGQEAREQLALTTPQLGKPDAIDASDSEKLKQNIGKIVTVEGTVMKTFHSERSDTRFFNFDKKGEKFEFIIFKGAMKNFEKTGDPIQFYQGKKIQVTGVLSLSPKGKPQIIVNRPDQIVLVR